MDVALIVLTLTAWVLVGLVWRGSITVLNGRSEDCMQCGVGRPVPSELVSL